MLGYFVSQDNVYLPNEVPKSKVCDCSRRLLAPPPEGLLSSESGRGLSTFSVSWRGGLHSPFPLWAWLAGRLHSHLCMCVHMSVCKCVQVCVRVCACVITQCSILNDPVLFGSNGCTMPSLASEPSPLFPWCWLGVWQSHNNHNSHDYHAHFASNNTRGGRSNLKLCWIIINCILLFYYQELCMHTNAVGSRNLLCRELSCSKDLLFF